ncbi:hypothetical protein DL766_002090 [Monosporascus sp. MC13-8B]|uniref:RTA1 domain protein n=1 Tax=Monosporascus cannonballus TaxID=155416 RepID=A0ABY0GXT3_9PEZI|nr:hypothetical protein DL762_008252 [Monosporascus cannonballus]RYO81687.1 hypothetical protein DL763_008501 [Monosporascus cannonballus]RYP36203.1 hypothetical protein DL766_002090 [Monosporascus sp. MC13-8B]
MASAEDYPLEDYSRFFPTYTPSLGGNVALLALFAVLIPIALVMGIRYNSIVFSAALATGLALEAMGYIGRILLRNGPSSRSSFALFFLGTVMGPNFISGAIFHVMPRIIAVYGPEFRAWRPSWYLPVFYGLTAVSLLLEIAGGVVSTTKLISNAIDTGVRVLAVGLAIYLIALTIFAAHAILFAIALRTRHHILDTTYASVYSSRLFRAFLTGYSAATSLILLRTAFRIVVVAERFQSSVAQAEVVFLIFDGAVVFLAGAILLILFPGRVFGRSWWEVLAHHPLSKPERPPRPEPVQLLPAQRSPGLNRASITSSNPEYSPRKAYGPPRPRNMVDSEALW